jgi:hypothetical protein
MIHASPRLMRIRQFTFEFMQKPRLCNTSVAALYRDAIRSPSGRW